MNIKSWLWKRKFSIPPHLLANIEIQKNYENESRFNGIYSRDNLSKNIKDGTRVINLDECAGVGTHWITLYISNNDAIYFNSFGVEHIPKEIKKFIGNKNMQTNILRLQANSSIMPRFLHWIYCFYALTQSFDHTNLFSLYEFEKK